MWPQAGVVGRDAGAAARSSGTTRRRSGSAGSRCSPTTCTRERRDVEDRRRGVLAEHQVVAPVRVRRAGGQRLGQDRVVVEQHAGRAVREPRRARRQVVRDVADPVDGPAERRLIAERVRRVVDEQVPQHADVVHAAVGLDRVVVAVRDVVAVEVDRDGAAVPVFARRILRPVGDAGARGDGAVGVAVGLDVDAVVEVGDVVVRDDVARAVELDGDVRRHRGREDLAVDAAELRPHLAGPADQVLRIVAADEHAVGDVEAARARRSS